MEGKSIGQSLAAAQAARNSIHRHSNPVGAYNGDTTIGVEGSIDRRTDRKDDKASLSFTIYPYYFKSPIGILRVAQLIVGIIVCATANAEQCVMGILCGSPSSPLWYGELGGQGFVLFVGIVFILGNFALIFYHLLTKPSSSSDETDNLRFAELVYDAVAIVFYIIAASVEAWYASWTTLTVRAGMDDRINQTPWNVYRPQWIASTIFAWINVLLYIADIVWSYFFDEEPLTLPGNTK